MNSYKTNKILRISLFTTLVLGSISLTLFPSTNSRFIKNSDTDTVLKFNSSINNLYGGKTELNHESNSTGENLYLKLTFDRNEIIRPNTTNEKTDSYYVEAPEYCTVYNNDVDNTIGSKEFTLNNDMKRNINVELDCVPESIANTNSGNVTVPIKIYEKYSNEEKFIYWEFDYYGGTLDEYYDKVGYDPNPPIGEDPVLPAGYTRAKGTKTEIFSAFQMAINELVNASGTEYMNSVKNFIYPIDIDSEAAFFQSIANANVLGVNLKFYEPTETREEYILDFKIDPNIVGYALYTEKNVKNTIYFSAQEEADVRNSLKQYLNNYYSDSDDALAVYDYIVLRSNNDVKGFLYEDKEPKPKSVTKVNKEGNPNGISLNIYTLPVALNFRTPNTMKIDYSLDMGSKWLVFRYSLYVSDVVSPETIEKLQIGANYKDLRTSITKNSTAGSYVAFTDFFIIDNSSYDENSNIIGNKKHLLIKVSSDPEVGQYNLVTLESLESELDITFESNTTNNTLDVKVVYKDLPDEVDEVKTKLETYFGLTLDDTNSTITTDTANKTVTISINKDKILEAAQASQTAEGQNEIQASEGTKSAIPETEIINNMQVKFLNTKPVEGIISNPLIVSEVKTDEKASCPIEVGVQLPCIELPTMDIKEKDFKEEAEIVEETTITA